MADISRLSSVTSLQPDQVCLLMTSQISYDAHTEVMINRAEFDVCMFSSLGGVKAQIRSYTRTDIICALCIKRWSPY